MTARWLGPGRNPLPLNKDRWLPSRAWLREWRYRTGLVEEVPASAASQRLPKRSHLRQGETPNLLGLKESPIPLLRGVVTQAACEGAHLVFVPVWSQLRSDQRP